MRWSCPLILGLALLLAGCSGGAGETTSASPKETAAPKAAGAELKVALLTPGPVSDAGWNALAYDGLQSIKSELGAEVANTEAVDRKIPESFRSYAQQGYQLVIGHGVEYNEFALQVAPDFPQTVFVSTSGSGTAKNVGAIRFLLEEGFYLAGMAAAQVSKTGTVGLVGVKDWASIVSTFKAFEAGARAAKPDIKIIPAVYFGTEGDVAGARRATLTVIDQGADVIIHQANSAAQGVFDAAKERKVLAIGANRNQNENASGAVLGSAVIDTGKVFVDIAKRVQSGEFSGEKMLLGMDKGYIDFVLNPALADRVPAEVQAKLAQAKSDIQSGKLQVPRDEF